MMRLWNAVRTGAKLFLCFVLSLVSFVGIMHARDNLALACCIFLFAVACTAAIDYLPARATDPP